jgi:uncharacterized protein
MTTAIAPFAPPASPEEWLARSLAVPAASRLKGIKLLEKYVAATLSAGAFGRLVNMDQGIEERESDSARILADLARGVSEELERETEVHSPLFHAALHAQNREAIDALLPFFDAKARFHGATPLLAAIGRGAERAGSLGVLAALLSASDPLATDEQGRSALFLAASQGRADAVRLLAPVSDLSLRAGKDCTPLLEAVAQTRIDCAMALLDGSDLFATDRDGHGVLDLLSLNAASGWSSQAQELLDALLDRMGAPGLLAKKNGSQNPLMVFAGRGCEAAVQSLLARGADPRACDALGQTAYLLAASAGSLECVRLLRPLSDAVACDSTGCDALMRAASRARHADLIFDLLPFGDLRRVTRNGDNALMIALHSDLPPDPRVLSALIEGSDLTQKNRSQRMAIDIAVDHGHWAAADELGLRASARTRERVLRAADAAQAERGTGLMPKTRAFSESLELRAVADRAALEQGGRDIAQSDSSGAAPGSARRPRAL